MQLLMCAIHHHERIDMMSDIANKFSVLINYPDLPPDELGKQAKELTKTLTFGDKSDLVMEELIVEMQSFPTWPKRKMTAIEHLFFQEEKNPEEVYPNMWIALRTAVTTPVIVASAEKSLSKLKLIKTYLRSTMSQERLSGLALININKEVFKQI
ncbi:hypothetical protein Pcinc_016433 [Petrolisthes cinctipes]|uniref:HAT C-terminal dimerisation domain-containing protein n=1 Tax=Petrolisthes cinctipes TaxID=88211 RepID=A0AAE1FSD4_PETCI|nr:hypothetical protein Pcinc_016433 [Petrolisthes cinctipes]